jgi:hypothetical protein
MKKKELVMEVFVLMGAIDYDAHYVLGVYASEQEAVDALGVYLRDETMHDRYYVDRRVLGAAAEYDSDPFRHL